MLTALYFSFLLLFTSVFSKPLVPTEICGTVVSEEQRRRVEADFQKNKPPFKENKAFAVNVYFHVITQDDSFQGGNIPDAFIGQQIQVLNSWFQQVSITWNLAGVDRTRNPSWFNIARLSQAEYEMKNRLHQGGPRDLNVYSVGSIAGNFRGYSTFPWELQSSGLQYDGILLDFKTLPRVGYYPDTNEGKILVHEAGHWVGLYHTFEGGCYGAGDQVDDTPAEASPASGCPVGRDTCAGGGLDPITNHMDYTNDPCRSNFTYGQFVRINQQLPYYRGL